LRPALRIVLIGLVIAAALPVYWWLFPSDSARVLRLVQEAAQAASWDSNGGALGKLAGPGRLAGMCTPDVEVLLEFPGASSRTLRGSGELREAAAGARTQAQSLQVELSNLGVTLDPQAGQAAVQGMATVRISTSPDPIILEVLIACRRTDGVWKIARVEPVKGLGL
jgi:hypothetical protein